MERTVCTTFGFPVAQDIHVRGIDGGDGVGTARVIQADSIVMPEERIQTIETELAQLNTRIDARIKSAIDSTMSASDARQKLIQVGDINWAIAGLLVSTIGLVVEHLPIFCS